MLNLHRFFSQRYLFIIGFLIISLAGCTGDKDKNIPDISNISLDLEVMRFEKDLLALDSNDIKTSMGIISKKYPLFFDDIFLGRIIPALQNPEIMRLFVTSPGIRQLYDTTMTIYGDLTLIEEQLTRAFKFQKYYFPTVKTPKVVTYISEYSLGNFIYEDMVGIGLDFYLGADYPHYNPNFFPAYIRRSMNKDHLVAKTMEAVANDLVGEPTGERLLDFMIQNGKKLFVLDLLLPYESDSIKLQYTGKQTSWLVENELQLWSHFIDEDLLYATRYKDIRKLIDHSPNAPGMPPEAPGRTANWIGWQIVKAYMKQHPKITPADLLKLTDAQIILDGSRYKPAR